MSFKWYSAPHGYSGFLDWLNDSWPADPMRDAVMAPGQQVIVFLVYPGEIVVFVLKSSTDDRLSLRRSDGFKAATASSVAQKLRIFVSSRPSLTGRYHSVGTIRLDNEVTVRPSQARAVSRRWTPVFLDPNQAFGPLACSRKTVGFIARWSKEWDTT